MPPLLEDPRFRQTWNSISHNAENATENAAAGIWTFSTRYVNPCLASITTCATSCFPDADERNRRYRERQRTRGRAEYSFDFYDDWDDEDGGNILGWGDDELDRLLAGSGSVGGSRESRQPTIRKGMSYGTSRRERTRKKSIDDLDDATIIPSTNKIGILGRLPFKLGGTLRYKPSAADLKDHPGRRHDDEGRDALLSDQESSEQFPSVLSGHRRQRSSTTNSGETTDSMRSRGDLFPSDGEDDAVPLSDEFAMALQRRNTGLTIDEESSGRTRASRGKRPAGKSLSRTISGTTQSSRTSNNSQPPFLSTQTRESSNLSSPGLEHDAQVTPTLDELARQEERLLQEEEENIQRKRKAAAELARQRGLSVSETAVGESQPTTKSDESNITSPADIEENIVSPPPTSTPSSITLSTSEHEPDQAFIPARLPHF